MMEDTEMSTKSTILDLLKMIKPTVDLENVDNIIDGGYLDSMEMMMLISSLMDTFGFELDVDLIMPENFNSVDAIVALVDRLKA